MKQLQQNYSEGKTYPWEVLPEIGEFIMKIGPTLSTSEYECHEGNIWIARSATVAPTAYIHGPADHRKKTQKYASLCIYPWQCNRRRGRRCRKFHCELKNAVLFNKVQVPHYNYVGDAVLGYNFIWVQALICSNVKSDKKLVVAVKDGEEKIETGLSLGAMLGDHVEVGCGSVLNPGTVIGRNSNIYPLSPVRGCIPADSIYKTQPRLLRKIKQIESALRKKHRFPYDPL